MLTPINFFNIDNVEKCKICHDFLHLEPTYVLPECDHNFHTSCIVSWFRTGDGKCPYCRDAGLNYCSKMYTKKCGWLSQKDQQKIKDLRAYSQRADAHPIVKNKFNAISELTEQEKEFNKTYREFDKNLKMKDCDEFKGTSIACLVKKAKAMKRHKRSFFFKKKELENSIIALPVVPLIIPRIVYLG